MSAITNRFHPRPELPLVEPDTHGQVALLLTESLMHALVELEMLTNTKAVETIVIAEEVKVEVVVASGESEGRMVDSLELLSKMAASFDADRAPDRPK